jgi:hypothetical protein
VRLGDLDGGDVIQEQERRGETGGGSEAECENSRRRGRDD